MKTIYITNGQIDMIGRSLNEGAFNKVVENNVPSAQDQVNGKVNAGIIDGVTGCGMMEEEMLCENQSDKLANDYVKNNIGIKDFQEIRDYIFQICHAIPNVRFNKRYYLLGVIRLIYEEKLRGRHLSQLNNILYNIRERNDILDRNLDGLSFMDLWEEYYNTEDSVNNVDSVEKIRKTSTGYVIKHIESYEESSNSGPQDWCITYDPELYYTVVNGENCIYIVENPEMMKSIDTRSKEFDYASDIMATPTLYDLGEYGSGEPPYDTYGLSRFVVLVNPNGISVYSRWNIPDDLDGRFLNREELEEIVGMPFNDAFPYVKPYELDDVIKKRYWLRESVENKDDDFTIDGITKDAESFKNAFKPIANFMKNEGLNVYPFPKTELNWDEQDGLFIKTGYYLPGEKKVVLFCKDRHPKDILRSYAHEMIHHMQNLNGDNLNFSSEDDVKDNEKLEKLESEAYLKGNIYFRKWTEYERSKGKKKQLNESPDYIESVGLNYEDQSAHPFILFKGFENEPIYGLGGETHSDIAGRLYDDVYDGENYFGISNEFKEAIISKQLRPLLIDSYHLQGRYYEPLDDFPWGGNIISLYDYTLKSVKADYGKLMNMLKQMQADGLNVDFDTLDFDHWNGDSPCRFPFTWIANGMAESLLTISYKITKNYRGVKPCYNVYAYNGNIVSFDAKGNHIENASSYLAENYLGSNIEEALSPSEVDLSSFNIKKELNPKFWKDDKLDSRIRIKLLDIADDFIEFLGIDWVKPEDITITGSLANYNWNKKYSDIDLHILIDYSKVDKRTDFVDNYFYSQKKLWNEEHKDLRIFGFPVEVYVQDVNKEHTSSGVYSLEKNEWVIEPEREKLSKKKVNKERIKKTVSQYTEKIDKLVDDSKNTDGDEYKMRKVYEGAQKLFDEIKKLRREDLSDANNEINEGNIIFKALRRLGYIDKLDKVINKGYNTLNSLP